MEIIILKNPNAMNFNKIIWKLFKMDRGNSNRFDRQVELLLQEVYEKGKQQGKKEERKRLKNFLR
jgi:hypothetical protein